MQILQSTPPIVVMGYLSSAPVDAPAANRYRAEPIDVVVTNLLMPE
jgi:hypothetical protein